MSLCLAALLVARPAHSTTRQGVDVQILFKPVVGRLSGGEVMRYELRITNFSKVPLFVRLIEVLDDRSGRKLASYSGESLAGRFRPVGKTSRRDGLLAPGELSIAYIDVGLPGDARAVQIAHRISVSDGAADWTIDTAAGPVSAAPRSDLGPPLEGGPWVAVYEPELDGGHRRAIHSIAGKAKVPGRFAIDFFKVDPHGNHVSGEGSPVLAVADGVVVAVSEEFPGQEITSRAPGPELDKDAGNYVALQIGPQRYAFYEHLKQGLLVRPGEKVRRGTVLGFLGATGHVTGPHLHFHVADSNSPLGADGIAFGFERLEVIGRYQSIDEFNRGGPWRAHSEVSEGLAPPNAVIRFPVHTLSVRRRTRRPIGRTGHRKNSSSRKSNHR